MKKLLFLLLASVAFAANVQVRDLSITTVLPAANDYLLVDGVTNTTTKSLAINNVKQVATRAALAGLSVTNAGDQNSVYVLGGSARGDGQGALYYYNATSTATPDGVSIIQPTVGSGRWLIVNSIGLPAPSPTTLGGVFSKAAVTHQYLTSVGTDGSIGQAAVSTSDISGLGTMASQNASSVAITGGAINSTSVGSSVAASGSFTTATAGTSFSVGGGLTPFSHLEVDKSGAFSRWLDTDGGGASIIVSSANGATGRPGIWSASTMYLTSGASYSSPTILGTLSTSAANFYVPLSNNSLSVQRTTKGNLNLVINVKDYGATGDGSTDDTSAINSAIAALTNNSTLYFPPGTYKNNGLSGFSSLTNLVVTGDGATLLQSATGGGGNTFVVNTSCSNVRIEGLRFVGSATARGSGIHIRLYASNAMVRGCYLTGCGDFAIQSDSNSNVLIEGNIIENTYGDGIHIGNNGTQQIVANNQISNTGDDAIGVVSDTAGNPPTRIVIVGNNIYGAGFGPSGSSGCGIRIEECNDVLAVGNQIMNCKQSGIGVGRFTSTTAYNSRIQLKGNKLVACPTLSGPRGSIIMNFCLESSVAENEIYDTPNGAAISYLDFNDLTIRGNTIRGSAFRAIASDDSTTTNVATSWTSLIIDANVIGWNMAGETIYAVPASGITIGNVLITSNVGNQLPAGNWIYYARASVGKIGNNTSRDGLSIGNGGSVSGITLFNNN